MKNLITFGLLGLAGYLLWRQYGKKDDLDVHLDEQRRLQDVSKGVQDVHMGVWQDNWLTTIGDTPLAGIALDPFNPDSISQVPKKLDLYSPTIWF